MLRTLATLTEGYLIPVLCFIGLTGNLIISSILKYPSLDMKTTFRHILLSLAIFDTIFSLLATLTFSLPWLSEYWKLWMMPLLLPYTIPGLAQFLTLTSYLSQLTLGLQMALNGSIWTTVCVALERYLSIGHPSQRMFDKSALFIFPVCLLAVAWNIPKFFELKTCYLPLNDSSLESEPEDGDSQTSLYPRVCTTSLRDNYRYSRDYLLIANFIVMAFIPFLLLIIFNSLTFRIIRNSSLTNDRTSNRQRRDQRIAKMFILIIIVFFICNMPRMILNAFDVLILATGLDLHSGWPEWSHYLSTFSNLLLVLNSSVNIFIYSWKDKKFRKVLVNKYLCLMRENNTNSNSGRKSWKNRFNSIFSGRSSRVPIDCQQNI